MKQQVDRRRKKVEEWKKSDKIVLSIKDLVFKERLARKPVDWYVGLYIINKVVFTNTIKLWLLTSMRIHLVMNISWVVRYREQVEEQKVEEVKLVEMDRIEEWEVEKNLIKEKWGEWWSIWYNERGLQQKMILERRKRI